MQAGLRKVAWLPHSVAAARMTQTSDRVHTTIKMSLPSSPFCDGQFLNLSKSEAVQINNKKHLISDMTRHVVRSFLRQEKM